MQSFLDILMHCMLFVRVQQMQSICNLVLVYLCRIFYLHCLCMLRLRISDSTTDRRSSVKVLSKFRASVKSEPLRRSRVSGSGCVLCCSLRTALRPVPPNRSEVKTSAPRCRKLERGIGWIRHYYFRGCR